MPKKLEFRSKDDIILEKGSKNIKGNAWSEERKKEYREEYLNKKPKRKAVEFIRNYKNIFDNTNFPDLVNVYV